MDSGRQTFGWKQWLISGTAALGFAFSLYETLMMPLIVRPVLSGVAHLRPGEAEFRLWVSLLLYVPAAVGGVFGMLGGYFTDRFGRRRMLVWSMFVYAAATFAGAFTTSLPAFLLLRCATWTGICVEHVAAVAWLAELFPNPRQRESVLGYAQAFMGLGGFMVTGVYFLAVTWAADLPAIHGSHDAWRYTMISGALPAIPLAFVRPLLPESPAWTRAKAAGTLRRLSIAELFTPGLRRTTVVMTFLLACSYALAYGAIQQLPQVVPGLPGVQGLPAVQVEQTVSAVQLFQELGGFTGRLLLAVLVVRIASQRRIVRLCLAPAAVVFAWLFFVGVDGTLAQVKTGVFVAALLFNALFSFWGNFLPRMFPTYLRGTGEGFATNIGGRVIGTSAALVTGQLAGGIAGGSPFERLAHAAGVVAVTACIAGLAATFWMREPEQAALPD